MIFFKTDATIASRISKVWNRCPLIDCDVSKSSTESTISNYLCLESSFSNTEMSKDQEIFRNACLRLDSSVVQPCNSADKLLLHEKEDSKLKVLQNSEFFSTVHPLGQQVFLCSETRARIVLC